MSHEWAHVPVKDVFTRLVMSCTKPWDFWVPSSYHRYGKHNLLDIQSPLQSLFGDPHPLLDISDDRVVYIGRVLGMHNACQQSAICPKKSAALAACLSSGGACTKEIEATESCVQAFFDHVRAIPAVKNFEQRLNQRTNCPGVYKEKILVAAGRTIQGLDPPETFSQTYGEFLQCMYGDTKSFPELAACIKSNPIEYSEACDQLAKRVEQESKQKDLETVNALGFTQPADVAPSREWRSTLAAEAKLLGIPDLVANDTLDSKYAAVFRTQVLTQLANRFLLESIKQRLTQQQQPKPQ